MDVECHYKGCTFRAEHEKFESAARSLLAHVRQKHPALYKSKKARVLIQ